MEQIIGFWDYFGMFAAAIISGALGGLGFELMQVRFRTHTGALELPHPLKDGHYLDLGVWSNIFLGAITAVAVLYFFPPDTKTTIHNSGVPDVVIMSYDIVKLIAFSLIAGSAGPSFLSSMQGRLAGALQTQKADVVGNLAQKQLTRMVESTTSDLKEVHNDTRRQVESRLYQLHEMISTLRSHSAVAMAVNGNGKALPEHESEQTEQEVIKHVKIAIEDLHAICDTAEADLQNRLQRRGEAAKEALTAIGSPSHKEVSLR